MARRKRRRDAFNDKMRGSLFAVLGIAMIASLAAGTYWVRSTRTAVDGATFCPQSGPRAVHVILVDRSDPVTGQQAQRIRQVIQQIKTSAEVGTRFDVYSFEGDSINELPPRFTICVPPREANEWIENPARIRKRYEDGYSKAVDAVVDDLLTASTLPSSPIIESFRAAAQTSFGAFEGAQIPFRVTLVSDMVQHTNAVSHLRAEPNFQQLSHQQVWASLRPHLKGAETNILYVLRNSAMRKNESVQNRGHQAFWNELIADAGGRLVSIEPF